MREARGRFWQRTGPLAVLSMFAVAATTEGCGCSDDTTPAKPGTTTSTSTTGAGGSSEGGGGSSAGGGGSGAGTASIAPAAEGATPFDATPDPTGETIYFTGDNSATDPMGGAGVFKVATAGGTVTPVKVGDPFVAPFGIAIDTTGAQLYIADPASETDSDDKGRIFALPVGGGNAIALGGTEGTVPRGLEIYKDEQNADQVVFSGTDPATGDAGVFSVPATGGAVTKLAAGSPFVDPSGVAVSSDGKVVFVADPVSAATRKASIFTIENGGGVAFVEDLDVGYPVGIALSKDDKVLFVSGLDPVTLTDVVIQIDVASKTMSTYTGDATDAKSDLTKFFEPAGLHRAKGADVFAWADSRANAGGTVFAITVK